MRKFLIALITLYQKTLSPDHGALRFLFGFYKCRFYPTCSQYAKEAIKQEGVWRGARHALSRIARCNGSCGGYDPYTPH